MLITYNLRFGQVKKLYRAQQRSSNKKSKFKKHHVAYGVLHIKSALRVRLRGGVVWLGAFARISTWKIAATVKNERKDL